VAPFRGRSAAASPPPPRPEEGEQGIRGKIEGIFSGKSKLQVAQCFECNGWHEVSSTAQSSTCKACGAYIDLQDYKVNGSFSRNIKTRGSVYLGSKGDLSSSKIVCSQAVIHGKMRGNLTCEGKVTIRVQGKLFGSVEAGELVVEKGSEVVFSRPIHASTAEIHGRMSGDVVAEGLVTIFKHGLLDGAVSASGFVVERGGCFQGELTISPRQRAAATRDDEAQATSTDPGVPASNPTFLAGGEESPALA
jgi:cytoskeletal protein CcmA (bactofilin family)